MVEKEQKSMIALGTLALIITTFVVVNDAEYFRAAIIYFVLGLLAAFMYIYHKKI